MQPADWVTLVCAAALARFLIYWRIKAVRARNAAPPAEHRPSSGITTHDEAERLIHGYKGHESY